MSRAARDAFERLLARCAGALRCGCAAAFAVAAAIAAPAPGAVTAAALVTVAGWSLVALRPSWAGRRPGWVVAGDVAVAIGVCLLADRLVPAVARGDGTSWAFLVASTVVIVSQLGPRALPGIAATVLVTAGYVAGLGAPGAGVLLVVQGVLVGAMMVPLRRAAAAADAALDSAEAAERDAAVRSARRAEEREHDRLLHDSVSATLTVVAAAGLTASSPTLRTQAAHDLTVLARLHTAAAAPAAAPAARAEEGAAGREGAAGPDGTAGRNEGAGDVADDVAGAEVGAWVGPVVDGAGLAVEGGVPEVLVPARVGAAVAAALTEALGNAARHAPGAAARVEVRALPGGVEVELADDGPGFDPAAVPVSRRGIRESVVARMRAAGGDADVTSAPGAGTRVTLRWQAAGTPEPLLGELVARTYRRGLAVAVVVLVVAWHLVSDLPALLSWAGTYRSVTAEVVAWLVLAGVAAVGGVRLLAGRTGPLDRVLAAGVAAACALATAAVPGDRLLGGAGWAWGAAGWFGVLVLLRRPPAELVVLLAANSAVTAAVLAYDGVLDRTGLARFATVVYGTAALQLTVAVAARALDATGRRAAAVAAAESAVRRRRQVADALHETRRDRYATLHRELVPLLTGLADGTLDPGERATRHRCAVGASRLRRLFAETDDVPDPLVHELRACTDIADRRGVLVDLQVRGRVPRLDRDARRGLTERPLVALAAAERNARVTVVARHDEVAVSVLADADWVEERWRP